MRVTIVCLCVLALLLSLGSESESIQTEKFDAWVGFKDKGKLTEKQKQDLIKDLKKTFRPRALKRRKLRRTAPGLFDERDFPLKAEYIKGVAATGAEVKVSSRWMNGITVYATSEQLRKIEALPYVLKVTDAYKRKGSGRYASQPEAPAQINKELPDDATGLYGRSNHQVRQLGLHKLHQAGYTGEDVVIAILDCGFDLSHIAFNHPQNPLKVLAQWDFVDSDAKAEPEPKDPPEQHYHGTYILGAAAANLPDALMGTAPNASYILCKAEEDAEEFLLEERWFVAALEYAESLGADIVSSSLGLYIGYSQDQLDGKTSVLAQGWRIAVENGIIGLQGGGNYGHDSDPDIPHLFPPADAIGVIAVGAVLRSGEIAPFSSDGPTADGRLKPEVLALGADVWSVSATDARGFVQSSGTSLATPLLAGAVACLLQAHPDWKIAQIRQALFHSGDYFRTHGKPDPLFIYGYGIPNIFLASGLTLLP